MRLRLLIGIGMAIALSVQAPSPAVVTAAATAADEGLVGTVREADGTPAAGVQVWLVRTWEEGATEAVTTGPDGRYRLPAAPGEYIEAMFSATTLQRPPGGYRHAIRRQVYENAVTILAGRPTPLDVVMPDAAASGSCWMTGCSIDVSAVGFTPGEIVAVSLTAGLIVDGHSFEQRLATLPVTADGSARGTFVVDGLARAGYGIAVVNTPLDAVRRETRTAETARILSVGPPPCTDPSCEWRAWSSRLGSSAALILPASSRAGATLTASAPAPGVTIGGRITAGAGCGADAEVIATFPGYRATSTRERTQRIVIGGASLARLRVIEQDGTPLWFRFAVGTRWSCVRLWRRH
jgi:hypothetical protein